MAGLTQRIGAMIAALALVMPAAQPGLAQNSPRPATSRCPLTSKYPRISKAGLC